MSVARRTERAVLVAEDEPDIAEAYRLYLELSGFDVDVAKDGRAALKLAITEAYDVMLLDLLMPLKNGFEILEELQARGITERMPILVISNLSQQSDADRCRQLGAADYALKSNISLEALVKKVRKLAKR